MSLPLNGSTYEDFQAYMNEPEDLGDDPQFTDQQICIEGYSEPVPAIYGHETDAPIRRW